MLYQIFFTKYNYYSWHFTWFFYNTQMYDNCILLTFWCRNQWNVQQVIFTTISQCQRCLDWLRGGNSLVLSEDSREFLGFILSAGDSHKISQCQQLILCRKTSLVNNIYDCFVKHRTKLFKFTIIICITCIDNLIKND